MSTESRKPYLALPPQSQQNIPVGKIIKRQTTRRRCQVPVEFKEVEMDDRNRGNVMLFLSLGFDRVGLVIDHHSCLEAIVYLTISVPSFNS
jgi:hypothetical protein